MRNTAFAQGRQAVTAFQDGHDATFATRVGDFHQFLRQPDEVLGFQIQSGQWVEMVGIETCRDD